MITQAQLKAAVHYDPDTGAFTRYHRSRRAEAVRRKKIVIGYFPTAREAAAAYVLESLELFGNFSPYANNRSRTMVSDYKSHR